MELKLEKKKNEGFIQNETHTRISSNKNEYNKI